MTGIKLCGLTRPEDIAAANSLKPDYIGFVFAPWSRRYVSPEKAMELKNMLDPSIKAVGVFVDEELNEVSRLLDSGITDIAQLHGKEDDDYILRLRRQSKKPLIKAFRIKTTDDIKKAEESAADHILLDSGTGSGNVFDWDLLGGIRRPYFLAGGLSLQNTAEAIRRLRPYALDVSSGIETDGVKDKTKMEQFVSIVRSF